MEDKKAKVQDPLEEMNFKTTDNPRPVYINALLSEDLK